MAGVGTPNMPLAHPRTRVAAMFFFRLVSLSLTGVVELSVKSFVGRGVALAWRIRRVAPQSLESVQTVTFCSQSESVKRSSFDSQ